MITFYILGALLGISVFIYKAYKKPREAVDPYANVIYIYDGKVVSRELYRILMERDKRIDFLKLGTYIRSSVINEDLK